MSSETERGGGRWLALPRQTAGIHEHLPSYHESAGLRSQLISRQTKNVRVSRYNENNANRGKNQGDRGHRKIKCELNQGLVMINLYVKFNMHFSKAAKQNR